MEETMIHPETGEILHRDIKPIEYEYKGEKITVNQPGWYPAEGDEGILSWDDMKISDQALEILKARYAEKMQENNFVADNVAFA